jgi:hypothetical protein
MNNISQKLIKIKNEKHYIIVDDSQIKEGDFMYDVDGDIGIAIGKDKSEWEGNRKITHSVKPLEEVCCTPNNQIKRYIDCKGCDKKQLGFNKIKPLFIQEVEELLSGYSVEKMVDDRYPSDINDFTDNGFDKKEIVRIAFCDGFNAHKELVKDKLFTMEDMIQAIGFGFGICRRHDRAPFDLEQINFIKSLQPTEWDVHFINGKLTLK